MQNKIAIVVSSVLLWVSCSSNSDPMEKTEGPDKTTNDTITDIQRAFSGPNEPGTCDATFEDDFWYDTDDHVLKVCIPPTWLEIEGSSLPGNNRNLTISQGATTYNSTDTFSFGTLPVGQIGANVTFTLENTGVRPLTLYDLPALVDREEDDSFVVEVPPSVPVLAPGQTVDIEVSFYPRRAGRNSAEMYIRSDDDTGADAGQVFQLHLEGYGAGISSPYAGRSDYSTGFDNPVQANGWLYFVGQNDIDEFHVYGFDGHEIQRVRLASGLSASFSDKTGETSISVGTDLLLNEQENGKVLRLRSKVLEEIPVGASGYMTEFASPVNFSGNTYFSGNDGSEDKIFSYDGSNIVAVPTGVSSYVSGFDMPTVVGSRLYFIGSNGTTSQVYAVDTGTIVDVGVPAGADSPSDLIAFEGNLYLQAQISSVKGVYYFDGTQFRQPYTAVTGFTGTSVDDWQVVNGRLLMSNSECESVPGNGCYIEDGRVQSAAVSLITAAPVSTFNGDVYTGSQLSDGFSVESAAWIEPVIYRENVFHNASGDWQKTNPCGASSLQISGSPSQLTDKPIAYQDALLLYGSVGSQSTAGLKVYYEENQNPVVPQLVLSSISLAVTEAGTNDTVDVSLNRAPNGTVRLYLTSGNTAEVTVSPAFLDFDGSNWATPQTVTVTGVADQQYDGDQVITLAIRRGTSGTDTTGFCVMPTDASISVTNTNTDAPIVYVSEVAGDDVNDGTYYAPVKTFEYAYNTAGPALSADVMRIADGSYEVNAQVNLSDGYQMQGGFDDSTFTTQTFDERPQIVDQRTSGSSSEFAPLATFNASGITNQILLQGIEITPPAAAVAYRAGIVMSQDVQIKLENVQVESENDITPVAFSDYKGIAYLQDDTATAYDVDIDIEGEPFGDISYGFVDTGEVDGSGNAYAFAVLNNEDTSDINITIQSAYFFVDSDPAANAYSIYAKSNCDTSIEIADSQAYGTHSAATAYGVYFENTGSGTFTTSITRSVLSPKARQSSGEKQVALYVKDVAGSIDNSVLIARSNIYQDVDNADGVHVDATGSGNPNFKIVSSSIVTKSTLKSNAIKVESDNVEIWNNILRAEGGGDAYAIREVTNHDTVKIIRNNLEGETAKFFAVQDVCGSPATPDCTRPQMDGLSADYRNNRGQTLSLSIDYTTDDRDVIWDGQNPCLVTEPSYSEPNYSNDIAFLDDFSLLDFDSDMVDESTDKRGIVERSDFSMGAYEFLGTCL